MTRSSMRSAPWPAPRNAAGSVDNGSARSWRRAEIYGKARQGERGADEPRRPAFVRQFGPRRRKLRHRIANTLGCSHFPSPGGPGAQLPARRGHSLLRPAFRSTRRTSPKTICPCSAQRQAAALVDLNVDLEVERDVLPRISGSSIEGKPADALIFANIDRAGLPEARSEHAGRPPTSGASGRSRSGSGNRPLG